MTTYSKETLSVLKAIKDYNPIRPSDLCKKLSISNKSLYKHIDKLLADRKIKKTKSGRSVFYSLNKVEEINFNPLDTGDLLIEQNYMYVSPLGEMVRGVKGFNTWCQRNNTDAKKQKSLFVKKLKQVSKIKKDGLICAKNKTAYSQKTNYLDDLYYSDFYNIDHFGKTKLGQLVYLGKVSQNKDLIFEIAGLIKPALKLLIDKKNIQQIAFIPPTIDRKVQFLESLKGFLDIKLPNIILKKVDSSTKVAQKTLRKLEDRIVNARSTIALNPNQEIKGNVLLIDDATGSGATLNETAKKIKNISDTKVKVFGYSVVGSFKNFDVISEV